MDLELLGLAVEPQEATGTCEMFIMYPTLTEQGIYLRAPTLTVTIGASIAPVTNPTTEDREDPRLRVAQPPTHALEKQQSLAWNTELHISKSTSCYYPPPVPCLLEVKDRFSTAYH